MPGWDPEDIKAEIRKRRRPDGNRWTLTSLALDNGLSESACRVALLFDFLAGEAAIIKLLDVDPREIWPTRYSNPSPVRAAILNRYLTRQKAGQERQKRRTA